MQKLWKKTANPFQCCKHGGDFNTNYNSNVEIEVPKLYATKGAT